MIEKTFFLKKSFCLHVNWKFCSVFEYFFKVLKLRCRLLSESLEFKFKTENLFWKSEIFTTREKLFEKWNFPEFSFADV